MTAYSAPRSAPGCTLLFLEDCAVLFSAPRQELHHFNLMAGLIWCLLEDGLEPPAMADRLAADAGLAPETAAAYVAEALAGWAERGLVVEAGLGGEALESAAPVPEAPAGAPMPDDALPAEILEDALSATIPNHALSATMPNHALSATMPNHALSATMTCRLLDTVSELRFVVPAHAALAETALHHLRSAEPPDCVVDIVPLDGAVSVFRDGQRVETVPSDAVLPAIIHGVWLGSLQHASILAEFHAGVVAGRASGAGAVLMPASPGSGKSTLTAALAQAGYVCFSDEVAPLDEDGLCVRPFPLPLCVKTTGADVLRPLFPGLDALPVTRRAGDGKYVTYMPPPPASLPDPAERRPVSAVVFPRYVPGAVTTQERLPPGEALRLLLAHCQFVPFGLTLASVRRLIDWIACLPAWSLTFSRLEEAVGVVGAILDDASGAIAAADPARRADRRPAG